MIVNGDAAGQRNSADGPVDLAAVRAWVGRQAGRVTAGIAPGAAGGADHRRCARGNGGRHLLSVDPARDLVIASHWGDDIGELISEVSAAVPATAPA